MKRFDFLDWFFLIAGTICAYLVWDWRWTLLWLCCIICVTFSRALAHFIVNVINVTFRGLPWIRTCTREQPHNGPCNGWACKSVREKMERK